MGLENFSSLDAPEVNLAVGEGKSDKTSDANARRKQKMREMNELFKDSLMKDPTFSQKLRTLSESVAVVNTLDSAILVTLLKMRPAPKRTVN